MNLYNSTKLCQEFIDAGLPIVTCGGDGVHEWSRNLTELELASVAQIQAAHNPNPSAIELARIARKENAKAEAKLATEFRTLTPRKQSIMLI